MVWSQLHFLGLINSSVNSSFSNKELWTKSRFVTVQFDSIPDHTTHILKVWDNVICWIGNLMFLILNEMWHILPLSCLISRAVGKIYLIKYSRKMSVFYSKSLKILIKKQIHHTLVITVIIFCFSSSTHQKVKLLVMFAIFAWRKRKV